jgi:hypothetical protein
MNTNDSRVEKAAIAYGEGRRTDLIPNHLNSMWIR